MNSFDWAFPYSSRRMPVIARNVIATSQPLAAQAGLHTLRSGGNAIDAALAAAITLVVVEPSMNGLGSDAFAIVWDGTELHGLNASGRSPAAWTPERFAGREKMPSLGWDTVTVPGAVSAWVELSRRFGKLPFKRLFESAIHYARNGFHVSPITARGWASAQQDFAEFPSFAEAFLPGGSAPLTGERFALPALAESLKLIAQSNGEQFYRGKLARSIADHARNTGGTMTEEDLASHQADWVGTVSSNYRGWTLHEIPPNGQGLIANIALCMLEYASVAEHPVDSADSLHLQMEAIKLSFADADAYIADPQHMPFQATRLLDPGYLRSRAALIRSDVASIPCAGMPPPGGTVYLTAADENGMMVSFIQSNFAGFGSGIVIPGTGIAMQNRGAGFCLTRGHPNEVGPRKRPFHTIIPGFVMQDGKPLMSFGVMGGSMQAQGHAQVILRMRDHAQNPQAAIDAPRWRLIGDGHFAMEKGFAPEVCDELERRGHLLERNSPTAFGGAQLIYRNPDGGYIAASDPRKDGQAVGY